MSADNLPFDLSSAAKMISFFMLVKQADITIEIDMINESSRFMKLNSPYTKNEISGNCETDF